MSVVADLCYLCEILRG